MLTTAGESGERGSKDCSIVAGGMIQLSQRDPGFMKFVPRNLDSRDC
jgi:hypothetical protein